ncbi:MAG: conjugative transposon protein TraN [Cyclobacteriaceae bacterium]
MKPIFSLLVFLLPGFLAAQSGRGPEALRVYPLNIAEHTTTITFPANIVDVDVGSISVLVAVFDQAANILKVKSNQPEFTPTSLHVVTDDGQLWIYEVYYNAANPDIGLDMGTFNPQQASLHRFSLDRALASANPVGYQRYLDESPTLANFKGSSMTAQTIRDLTKEARMQRRRMRHIGIEKQGIKLYVTNILVKKDVMFFQLRIRNRSHIEYEIESFTLLVKDKNKSKKTSYQEKTIEPLVRMDELTLIEGHTSRTVAFPIEKLTVSDDKKILIQIFEKQGGRHLEIPIYNDDLLESSTFDNAR